MQTFTNANMPVAVQGQEGRLKVGPLDTLNAPPICFKLARAVEWLYHQMPDPAKNGFLTHPRSVNASVHGFVSKATPDLSNTEVNHKSMLVHVIPKPTADNAHPSAFAIATTSMIAIEAKIQDYSTSGNHASNCLQTRKPSAAA